MLMDGGIVLQYKEIKMKRYRIHYRQSFNGEVLEDSYTRTVESESDLIKIKESLYDDPHVFDVFAEEIREET